MMPATLLWLKKIKLAIRILKFEQLKALIQKTEEMIRNHFLEMEGSHDWCHIDRVRNLALILAEKEGGNVELIELAALLHDLEDYKLKEHFPEGQSIQQWLMHAGSDKESTDKIVRMIEEASFKGSEVDTPCSSLESMILQDADRLDAIGAIGIARAFAYGGKKGHPIYLPDEMPARHTSFEAYQKHRGSTIHHFHEKLLLIKERINTQTAKKIAEERHQFMEAFLNQFALEWNPKKLELQDEE